MRRKEEDDSYLKLCAKNVSAEVWEAQHRTWDVVCSVCSDCLHEVCIQLLFKCMWEAEGWKNPSEEELWCLRMCVWPNCYLGVGRHKIACQVGSGAVFLVTRKQKIIIISSATCFPLTLCLLFGTIYVTKEEGGLKRGGLTTEFHLGILRARVQPQCRRKSWQQLRRNHHWQELKR